MIEAAKLEADIYPAGPRGLSAYEIYKKEGGQLSEEEWLKSLNGLTPTIGENGNWFLGTVDTGLPSRGPKGDTGSIKFIVVTELPTENIDETAIYLKPVESPTGENKFEELIYVNGKWEDLGTPNVAVDLSNYYTKTEVKQITGELTNLNTEDKSNLVNAINEAMESGGGECKVYNINTTESLSNKSIYFETNVLNEVTEIINKNLDNTFILFINFTKNDNKLRFELYFKTPTTNSYNLTREVYGYSFYRPSEKDTKKRFTLKYDNHEDGSILLTQFKSETNPLYELTESDVLTKTNTTSYTPTSDYHPATKKYVDDTVAGISGGDLGIEIFDFGRTASIADTTKYTKNGEELGKAITRVTENGSKYGTIIIYGQQDWAIFRVNKNGTTGIYDGYDLLGIRCYFQSSLEYSSFTFISFRTGIDPTTNKLYTCNKIKECKYTADKLLTMDNTTSYTPTSDYNPATKKYVDDQVGNINTVLATLTTVSEVTK